MNLNEIMKLKYNKSVSDCTNKEIYYALLETVQNMSEKKLFKKSKKKKIISNSHSINNFNRIFSDLGGLSKRKNNR